MKETVSTFMEELGTFDRGPFIFQLQNTMKNTSDRLKHRIEGIGTRISRLDEETCKLDKCVEDVKSSEERYHGTTHRKLKQMQSVLQEVYISTYLTVMVLFTVIVDSWILILLCLL